MEYSCSDVVFLFVWGIILLIRHFSTVRYKILGLSEIVQIFHKGGFPMGPLIYGNKLVNTIETKMLCISSSNLAEVLIMVKRMGPIDFKRSRVTVGTYGNKLVN